MALTLKQAEEKLGRATRNHKGAIDKLTKATADVAFAGEQLAFAHAELAMARTNGPTAAAKAPNKPQAQPGKAHTTKKS